MRSNRSGVGEFEWRAIQRGRTLSRGSSLNTLLLSQPSLVGRPRAVGEENGVRYKLDTEVQIKGADFKDIISNSKTC